MPRILHAIDTTGPGGAETMFVSLAEHFSRPPYQSIAMIRGPGWVKDQLDARGILVVVEESRGSLNFSYLRRFIRHLKEHEIDLIHAHLPGANLYGAMAARIAGIPAISTWHGNVDLRGKGRLDGVRHAILRRWSRSVVVSEAVRDELSRMIGVDASKILVIPNGIDCARFANAEALGLRESLGIPAENLLIGSLGNVRPAKAYDTGLRVLKALRERGVDAWWLVAGQNRPGSRLAGELHRLAEELGVADCCRFLGFVEAPERFLAELDVYLLCSRSEGHPLALTQAMAAGKPVVATRCGIESVIHPKMKRWLTDIDDVAGLADAVQQIARGGPQVSEACAEAQVMALGTFDQSVAFARYEALYDQLLRGRV